MIEKKDKKTGLIYVYYRDIPLGLGLVMAIISILGVVVGWLEGDSLLFFGGLLSVGISVFFSQKKLHSIRRDSEDIIKEAMEDGTFEALRKMMRERRD